MSIQKKKVFENYFCNTLPENPEFGDGYRTWSKNKVFGFGSRQQVFGGGCKFSSFRVPKNPKKSFFGLFLRSVLDPIQILKFL